MLITILVDVQAKSIGISCCGPSELTPSTWFYQNRSVPRTSPLYLKGARIDILWFYGERDRNSGHICNFEIKYENCLGYVTWLFWKLKDQICKLRATFISKDHFVCVSISSEIFIWMTLTRVVVWKGSIRSFVICQLTFLEFKDWNL